MSTIKILDPFTANQIAAGEVVERPASVVKELCENALDAGASVISISIQNGGIVSISVVDNGTGMDREDARIAFQRHSTSKLNSIMDLDTIQTMGFRGEALASIASVSKVTLRTKQIGSPEGSVVRIEDGQVIEYGPAGCAEGTGILVEYLFYNTPARYKFLKKDATEAAYITDFVERFILARPDVSFRLFQNNQESLHSPGNNDLKSSIFSVYGKAVTQSIVPLAYQTERIRIDGFVGKPEIARNTRQHQSFFVNRRYVRSKTITAAVEEGFKTLLMKGRFAFCVIHLDLAPHLVDVNVHPQKTEVKFWNDQEVFLAVVHAIREALSTGMTIQGISPRESKKTEQAQELFQYPIQEQLQSASQPFSLREETTEMEETGDKINSIEIAKTGEKIKRAETALLGEKEEKKEKENKIKKEEEKSSREIDSERVRRILSETDPLAVFQDAPGKQVVPDGQEMPRVPEIQDSVEPMDMKIHELSKARFIGILFNTYLLMELEGHLIFIDQHAAHERILFEKLILKHKNRSIIAQPLLTPMIMEFPAHETGFISESLSLLSQIGFEVENFGIQSVVLRSVPMDLKETDLQDAFQSVLDSIKDSYQTQEEKIVHAFFSMACKAAVKANDILDAREVTYLLDELQKIVHPTHCPHGRPVVLKMSKYDIEKVFKRIVT